MVSIAQLAVASTIGEDLVKKVIILCTEELVNFSQMYRSQYYLFHYDHVSYS